MKQTILNYMQLMRAPALFTALSNIFAAHLILFQGEFHWFGLFSLLGATAMLYSGGMVLNDWFDYAVDLQERPTRPLPSGRIPRRHALIFGTGLLTGGVVMAAFAGPTAFYLALAIAVLVLLYDAVLKRTAIGTLVMGGCRYLNWLLGLSLQPLSGSSLALPIPIFLYVVSLTLLSREEESADNPSTAMITIFGILLAGLSLISISAWQANIETWKVFILLIGCGFLVYRLWQIRQRFTPSQVQSGVRLLILSIIPLDALLVMFFGPLWGVPMVLALLLPGKVLARMMYIT
jgi:4-hydroxybenzoate polyprenyltransferase